jgi:RNA polymerase sigma-32 factor
MKQGFKAEDAADDITHRDALTDAQIDVMARELNVKPEEVREMETRLSGGDMLLDPAPSDGDGEQAFGPIAYLSDAQPRAHGDDRIGPARHAGHRRHRHALKGLDERSRRIVTERWLNVNDDGSGGMTLHELAAEYGVSAERIRQIEVAAMKKMRTALAEYA